MNTLSPQETVNTLFYAAIKAVDPYLIVRQHLDSIRALYKSGDFGRFLCVSFGKAAYPMAQAAVEGLGNMITDGIVITKYGHGGQTLRLKLYEAGHPIPDQNGFKATTRLLDYVKDPTSKTLVLCLISGGGSALLVAPYEGITLEEKQKTTDVLMKAGADIYELNTVRKHISRVKGGRLAEALYPARVVSFLVSDVIGDPLDVIASGPTSPDPTTFKNAIDVIAKYGLKNEIPSSVLTVLETGVRRIISETPKTGSPVFEAVDNKIVANNRLALDAALKKADKLGLTADILVTDLQGEAREVAVWLAKKAKERQGKSICLISGGETTVTVRGNGKGGRNMELALAFALEIEDSQEGIILLSAGTDGTDGPTDSAGAVVESNTIKQARAKGLVPENYLQDNDAYTFFKKTGGLLITGPTMTNVMDIQVILIR
jgi:glycerate-2-kinase